MARSAEDSRVERGAFRAFLDACPGFATEVEEWSQPETQFPDVTVRLRAGRVLEFELGEWLHPAQMGAAKRRESLEEQLVAALGSLGNNPTANVRFVLLEPHEPAPKFDGKDGGPSGDSSLI